MCTRITKPAVSESAIIRYPIVGCEMVPRGIPGLLEINGIRYTVEVIGTLPPAPAEPQVSGYRLTKDNGESHDLCLVCGVLECSCGDYLFRRQARDPRGCKHVIACRRHFPAPNVDMAAPVDAIDRAALLDGEARILSGPEFVLEDL